MSRQTTGQLEGEQTKIPHLCVRCVTCVHVCIHVILVCIHVYDCVMIFVVSVCDVLFVPCSLFLVPRPLLSVVGACCLMRCVCVCSPSQGEDLSQKSNRTQDRLTLADTYIHLGKYYAFIQPVTTHTTHHNTHHITTLLLTHTIRTQSRRTHRLPKEKIGIACFFFFF